jgi:two-component system sensor histidine kinase ChvG
VVGAVYVTRSTAPVLEEMHRIRKGLTRVLFLALSSTALITFALSLTISRPLERLSQAARRIAAGTPNVPLPVEGGGEIRELGESFAEMTRKLEDRHRYISEFAADVAHEFKSPLTSIRGAAELLTEGADDDPRARQRFLDNIALDAARLDRLVSRLLELSRIEASEVEPTLLDLDELVRRAVARSQTADRSVLFRYLGRARYVVARGADLETAVRNLIDNALRFSVGAVQVDVRDVDARRLAIVVTDQGPGIAPENLSKVFDRFFTTDSEHEGTGLGLAIVKSVAEAHGGHADVTSLLGAGAAFRIVLPVAG